MKYAYDCKKVDGNPLLENNYAHGIAWETCSS